MAGSGCRAGDDTGYVPEAGGPPVSYGLAFSLRSMVKPVSPLTRSQDLRNDPLRQNQAEPLKHRSSLLAQKHSLPRGCASQGENTGPHLGIAFQV